MRATTVSTRQIAKHVTYLLAVIAVVVLSCWAVRYAYLSVQASPHCLNAGCASYDHSEADADYFTGYAKTVLGFLAAAGYLLSLPSFILSESTMSQRAQKVVASMFGWAIGAYAIGAVGFIMILSVALSGSGITAP
jgi:hypothetical protein